jgi:cell pole-organizing protein PopZ
MSDQTAPEPTMEEILASIRRIISEDDAPQAESAPVDAADDEEEEAEVAPQAPAAREEVAAAPPPPAPEPAPAPAPTPAPQAAPEPQPRQLRAYVGARPAATQGTLVSPKTATTAASAFGELSAAVSQPAERRPAQPGDGRSLEDIAREMLQPMLRQWLDANLPRIVQAAVREEVERISRGRVG